MKKMLKRYGKSIMIFFIVTIIIVPLLIHICFKTNAYVSFFQAEWNAGDVLAFYGVLVGSVATVWGVYLSIQYSRSNYQEDIKNRVLPFISLTTLKVRSKNPLFNYESKNFNETVTNEYEEYKLEKIYYVIEKGICTARSRLKELQEENLKQGGMHWEADDSGAMLLVGVDLITIPIELENVGNGLANRLRIGLNPVTTEEKSWKYLTPIPLKVGQTFYVHVYCDDGAESIGSYALDLVYEDIYGNKYRQRFGITIYTANDSIGANIDLGCKQESV